MKVHTLCCEIRDDIFSELLISSDKIALSLGHVCSGRGVYESPNWNKSYHRKRLKLVLLLGYILRDECPQPRTTIAYPILNRDILGSKPITTFQNLGRVV